MKRLTITQGLLLVFALAVFFYSRLPLGTAVMFGDDEGCELMKAVMSNKGYTLYKDIWNDQPPVFTLVLGEAFKIFGTSLIVGRLVAVGFGLLLFGTFYWLVQERLGPWMATVATFLLVAAPDVALLSASVMLEVPAFAMALLSVCLIFWWVKKPHLGWLVTSGIIFGIALQIKLTAILVAPAILAELALASKATPTRSWWKEAFLNALQWGTAVVTAFFVILLIWARGSIGISWRSHFEEQATAGMISPKDFPFRPNLLWNHIECVTAAALGIVLILRHRRWREMAFPIVLLATVFAIHLVHRPFWSYYYLHFAIPLAWLSALAVGEVIISADELISASHFRLGSFKTWKGVVLCGLAALVLVRSEQRLESGITDMRNGPTVATDPIVQKMKQYAGRTKWAYADQEIYQFQAGLNVPPELTVVVMKRFWSHQISPGELVDVCKRYHVEQLLLDRSKMGDEWTSMLGDYELVYQKTNSLLYISKSIDVKYQIGPHDHNSVVSGTPRSAPFEAYAR